MAKWSATSSLERVRPVLLTFVLQSQTFSGNTIKRPISDASARPGNSHVFRHAFGVPDSHAFPRNRSRSLNDGQKRPKASSEIQRFLIRVQIPSPRLFSEMSPSTKMSKGFLICGPRVAPSKEKFKHTISRIWCFAGLSPANDSLISVCESSNTLTAISDFSALSWSGVSIWSVRSERLSRSSVAFAAKVGARRSLRGA